MSILETVSNRLRDQSTFLQKTGFFPNANYLNPQRFITAYQRPEEFYAGMLKPILRPIANAVYTTYLVLHALYSSAYCVANLLILQPSDAAPHFANIGADLVLALGLAIMAPIHVFSYGIELITRIVSAWCAGETGPSLENACSFSQIINKLDNIEILNSVAKNISYEHYAFLKPYENAMDFLKSTLAIVGKPLHAGLNVLIYALLSLFDLMVAATNLCLLNPLHAGDDMKAATATFSLAFANALMVPTLALGHTAAVFARLSSTWVNKVFPGSDASSNNAENSSANLNPSNP